MNTCFVLQVIDVIAKGAYGNVYLVRREDEKQNYAVKVSGSDHLLLFADCRDSKTLSGVLVSFSSLFFSNKKKF